MEFEVLGIESSSLKILLSSKAKEYELDLLEITQNTLKAVSFKECITKKDASKGRVNILTFLNEVKKDFGDRLIYGNIYERLKIRLDSKNQSISLAESCTAGLIASNIASISGSSSVLKGGVVAYSLSSKVEVLGVKKDTLDYFSAYSNECAIAMARGAMDLFKSDVAISTTGICGVQENLGYNLKSGDVFICVLIKDSLPIVVKQNFGVDRNLARSNASAEAVKILLANL